MKLTDAQAKYLRRLGHKLKPVIVVGDAGLSASLLSEFSSTIDHHELIKVRVRAGDREARDAIIGELCKKQSAELVTRIGNVALVYRPNADKPRISMPVR
jgi:RNA-binding protein